jgi:hypothetical protein
MSRYWQIEHNESDGKVQCMCGEWIEPAEICFKVQEDKQFPRLCGVCFMEWLKKKIAEIEDEKLDLKNMLGKLEMFKKESRDAITNGEK